LLTLEDVKNLANATENLRDRAFVFLLYESGARIGEMMNIRIKDVEFDKYGAKILIPEGKTGPRKIRLIASPPAISNWLNQHPNRTDKNSPLFVGISNFKRGKNVVYQNYRKMLLKTASKIGFTKPVNPHHFRHSRATELAKKLTEAQLCGYMGWIAGSKEAATYVHLSGRDIDNAILESAGIIEIEKDTNNLKPIVCPRCGIKNDPASRFCSGCSLGLDEKSIMEYDEQKEEALDMNTALKIIMSKPKNAEILLEGLLKTFTQDQLKAILNK